MSRAGGTPRRSLRARRRLLGGALGLALAALALALAGWPFSSALPHAAGASGEAEVSVQTDDSLPARDVTMIGSSPAEAPGETWGVGEIGTVNSGDFAILEYTDSGGWRRASAPTDASGTPLGEFEPDETPLMGATTPGGDAVLIGTVHLEGARHKLLLVRSPGGAFVEAPITTKGEGALIRPTEELYAEGRSPLIAPLEENGHAGALLVPIDKAPEGDEDRVLHWNGESWKEEPVELPASTAEEGGGFRVLAIADSSPSNAWLLAQLSGSTRDVALYHREEGRWIEVAPDPLTDEGQPFTVAGAGGIPHSTAQILTVTSQGMWVDGERADISEPLTMFFKPSSESESASSGEVVRAWCDPGELFPGCNEALPQALPSGRSRSFAWAGSAAPYGERVITGLGEGVTLRLEGGAFKRVLALGGSAAPNDVGASFGAAFASAREGWLGNDEMPVHLTPDPAPDRLQYYPVPFRHALSAVAPQPGQPIGAPTSQALAVGDDGEVARYMPGEGWEPETLFGPGGRHETPRLRAVAWPTPTRAYAVGELGEMWLWRAETDLWEKDPATPLNFRGNLLGIAFDPAEPSRGYAVGQQGVLLRYGKTWTEEAEASLPAEAQGASFTSIAFAGSEAIAAFRKIHLQGNEGATSEPTHYTGGILVNEGSGWHLDQQADEALDGEIPWAVAGLPDGGAAISATLAGIEGSATILERNSQSSGWEAAPPYPGTEAPGSLSIFREGGAVRVIGSGGLPETREVEDQRSPPAGFPPNLVGPYPLASGYVIRQTADGWSDQEHARNPAQDPLGEYKFYDQVYEPDPTAAVLISEDGSEGWAVGGFVNTHDAALDTADVARYPAEAGATPPGVQTGPIQPNAAEEHPDVAGEEAKLDEKEATFAIGGGAGCEAACADRARAGIGPDMWLSTAVHQAANVAGLRAFLYTGPRVTNGVGHAGFPVPYAREFTRYAELLGAAGALPVYPAPSPTDGGGPGSECEFQSAFGLFSPPLGGGPLPGSVTSVKEGTAQGVGAGSGCATYYAWSSRGPAGAVRTIVIDTSAEGGEWGQERGWLERQLSEAQSSSEPAIVIGNADLNARIAAASSGSETAAEMAQAIIAGHASAYFFDAPEENIQEGLDGSSTLAFGSGTLGYESAVKAQVEDFLGASGFLLVHVDVAARNKEDNVAPVSAKLIPNIGELALEGEQGTLLRRSEVANFNGLARRPRAGGRSQRLLNRNESDLYIPIPENCVGSLCAHRIAPEYTFTSSNVEVANFVAPNTASAEPRAVLLNSEEKPVPDPQSGLLCAYNAGSIEVTISAGGLSYSLPVTIQKGSVRRPCGTVPIKTAIHTQQITPEPLVSQPEVHEAAAPPGTLPPPVPPAPAIPVALQARPKPPAPFTLVTPAAAVATPLLPFVPPPVPSPARPSPPSGTSAVTSPVEVAQEEEESEEAPESVSNKAVAYRSHEHEPAPYYLLGLAVLAAFAGASVRRRPRRGSREVRIAPATVSARSVQQRRRGDGQGR